MELNAKTLVPALALALFGSVLFSSCERCIECSRTIQDNLNTSAERCGTPKELREFEEAWQDNSQRILDTADEKCYEVY